MQTDNNLGGYLQQFNLPISVPAIPKLTKWPNLQSLGFQASLKDSTAVYHGKTDVKTQLTMYSQANPMVLMGPLATVQGILLLNKEVQKLMTNDSTLGPVGSLVPSYPGFGATFAVSPDQLKSGTQAISKSLPV